MTSPARTGAESKRSIGTSTTRRSLPAVVRSAGGTIRSMKMPMTWSESTPDPVRLAPRLGEHGVEVLEQAGYAPDAIRALISEGALVVPQTAAPVGAAEAAAASAAGMP